MKNFSISQQILTEVNNFRTQKVRLVQGGGDKGGTIRYLKAQSDEYLFSQYQTIALIDLYWNSQFENGIRDNNGNRKLFLNTGKFRSEVSSKQLDLDTKNFRFIPDDYADPWLAYFLQKDFKEWAKDNDFGDMVNDCVDAFPRYGTVVLKKVEKTTKFLPLQNLICEQTADSLQTASHVIELHNDMRRWEIDEMEKEGDWDTTDLKMGYDDSITVYERYGYVPLKWYKEHIGKKETVEAGDENTFIDCVAIVACDLGSLKTAKKSEHVFFVEKIKERPYLEAHWARQHGRWLGIGVMEDQFENQRAKNMLVNILRRSLQWSSKRLWQSASADMAAKNLASDYKDGTVLEVGAQGELKEVNITSKNNPDVQGLLDQFEKNSDQKAFTYEVATGESLPSGTPFRLGVVLSEAANSYFNLKREKLGLFLNKAINEFQVPEFLKDMASEDKIIQFFSGEPGFDVVKEAAMQTVKTAAVNASLLSGNPAGNSVVEEALSLFEGVPVLPFLREKLAYKDAKHRYDLLSVDENIDIKQKLQTLQTLYQIFLQAGDPRAEKVLQKLSALGGETVDAFGKNPATMAQKTLGKGTPSPVAPDNAATPVG